MPHRVLTLRELNRAALARQMLLEREELSVPDAVARLVGLQAQVPGPPYIGLWTRLYDFRREDLTKSLERRQVLATVSAPTVVGEMGLLTEPRAAAAVTAKTRIDAHRISRDRFLEMLDDDSPAACKVIYEIGRTLSERMARSDESIAHIIARIERADSSHDIDVFQDTLLDEWGF